MGEILGKKVMEFYPIQKIKLFKILLYVLKIICCVRKQ